MPLKHLALTTALITLPLTAFGQNPPPPLIPQALADAVNRTINDINLEASVGRDLQTDLNLLQNSWPDLIRDAQQKSQQIASLTHDLDAAKKDAADLRAQLSIAQQQLNARRNLPFHGPQSFPHK